LNYKHSSTQKATAGTEKRKLYFQPEVPLCATTFFETVFTRQPTEQLMVTTADYHSAKAARVSGANCRANDTTGTDKSFELPSVKLY
jgi:hypothetical protein